MNNISETLAGRIAIVEIPGLNFSESHEAEESEFLKNISSLEMIKKLKPTNAIEDIFTSCLFGGYPQPFLQRDDLDFFDSWFNNYFKTYIDRDIRALFPT